MIINNVDIMKQLVKGMYENKQNSVVSSEITSL